MTGTAEPHDRAVLARSLRRIFREKRKPGDLGPVELQIALDSRTEDASGVLPKWYEKEIREHIHLGLQKVGTSDEGKARWLLRFAAADLATMLSGQRLDLRWEILAFVLPPSSQFMYVPIDRQGEIQVPVDSLHAWLREGIGQLRLPDVPGREQPVWILNTRSSWYLMRDQDGLFAASQGEGEADSTAERFEAEVARVLSNLSRAFTFCHNCGNPFIKSRRQAYCSPTCSQSFRTRKYRSKDPERARQQRHAAYERLIKRKHGPKVKVRRRFAQESN